jgi:hypothetical protein
MKTPIKCTQLTSALIFAMIVSNPSAAQVTDFKMNDYKYRTPGLKGLGLGLGSSSTLNAVGFNSFSYNLSPTVTYTRQYSLDKRQLVFWNWTGAGIAKPVGKENPLQWSASSSVDWTERLYIGNNFLQFGSNSALGVMRGQVYNDDNVIYNIAINPSVGVGQGRLEYISNAQMALFILEDLKEAGKIKGTVSKELTYKFTELITELYNTRIFDFRKRRNYEVAKIDSFLRQNKIISFTDVQTCNIIADNWNYAIQPNALESTFFYSGTLQVPSPNVITDRINQFGVFEQATRYSGTRKSILFNFPSQTTNKLLDDETGGTILVPLDSLTKEKTTTNTGANMMLVWENHGAISLQRQRVITFWASGGIAADDITTVYNNKPDSISKTQTNGVGIGTSLGYSFFPNSRTVISTFSQANVNYSSGKKNDIEIPGSTKFFLSTFIKASYFINFRSRLTGQGGIDISPNSPGSTFTLYFTLRYVNYLF